MFTINQLHEVRPQIMSDEHYKLVPKICECGHPIIINSNRTTMKCSYKYCPIHLSYRADKMFKEMGMRDIGQKTAYRMIVENKLTSHVDILSLTEEQMPKSNSLEVRKQYYHELQKGRKQTLSSVLRLTQLNNVGEQTATKILKGHNSFVNFFNEFDGVGKLLDHTLKALGQAKVTYNLSRMTYHLYMARNDLIRFEKYFEITELSDNIIPVIITGDVVSVYSKTTSFKPREKLLDFLNEKYSGIVSVKNSGKSLNEAIFLLTDSKRQTRKYREAMRTGTLILTFSDFCDYLEEKYGQGREDYEIIRRNG